MPARIVPPTPDALAEAAAKLQNGELIAFPTETVYGLGANALNEAAVARIFTAKGRPQTNPVIVHVADANAAQSLVREWPSVAQKLAEAFWPGPLTLVLPKSNAVPDIVTAGGQTVGVRVPAHPVALELLHSAGVPIAAPSANRSESVSPTVARHVADSLGEFVPDLLILDGGPCRVGLESTVLDVTGDVPRILRPGMVTVQMLREAIGDVTESGAQTGNSGNEPERSPGQLLRHYAPRKPVFLCAFQWLLGLVTPSDALLSIDIHRVTTGKGKKRKPYVRAGKMVVMPNTPNQYAALLYAALRDLDATDTVSRIVVEEPPHTPEWAAVHDRLRRAAAPAAKEQL